MTTARNFKNEGDQEPRLSRETFENSPIQTPDNGPPTKPCTRCHRTLPIAEFNRNAAAPDGRQTWCRTCMAERSRDNRKQAAAYYRALVRLRDGDRATFDRYYAEEQEKTR